MNNIPRRRTLAWVSPLRNRVFWTVTYSMVGQGLLILSGPVLARALGVQSRGHFAMLTLFPGVLATIFSFGVPASLPYFAKRIEDSKRLLRSVIPTYWYNQALYTLIVVGIVSGAYASWNPSTWNAALVAAAGAPMLLLHQYQCAILQASEQFRSFNVLRTVPAAAFTAAAIILFLFGSRSLVSYAAAWSAAAMLSAAIGSRVPYMMRLRRSGESRDLPESENRPMSAFGRRAMIATAHPFETLRLDQLLVGVLIGPRGLGIYVVGLAFANLPIFVGQAFGLALYPALASLGTRAASSTLFWRALAGLGIVYGTMVLVVWPLLPIAVRLLFGTDFMPAVPLARILLIAGAMKGARRYVADAARALGMPFAPTVSEMIGVAVFLCLALGVGLSPSTKHVALAVTTSATVALVILLILVMYRGSPRVQDA